MKQLIMMTFFCLPAIIFAQTNSTMKSPMKMKLNAGIVTSKMAETKAFYTQVLGFGVKFENEFYLLLHTPNNEAEISFLLPHHPSQQPLFHDSFAGKGMYFTIEVDNVDNVYQDVKNKGVDIKIELRNEPWGDRHFGVQDPNGIGIDIVTYSSPEKSVPDVQAYKVTWFSIPADNMTRAIKFYTEAFNWHIEPETKEENDIFSFHVAVNSKSNANYISEERGTLNGCIVKREIGLPAPAVLVEVDDLEAASKKVMQAGGKVITKKIEMKSLRGYFVLVQDTEGNYVELFQNSH